MRSTCLSVLLLLFATLSGTGAVFTVSTLNDDGFGSLRRAVLDANAEEGEDTIEFSVTGIITLAAPLPPITGSTVIQGPGTNLLTISGNATVNVLTFGVGTTNIVSGLTVSDGMATNYLNGAGIANAGKLAIANCALVSNRNFGGWGGAVFNSGDLFITNSTFSGNQVTGENGFGRTWPPSVNQWTGSGGGGGAAGLGGGLCNMAGTAIIKGCTFIGNGATGGSGGGTNGTGRGGGINGGQGTDQGGPGSPGGFASGGGGGAQGYNGGQGGFGGGGGGGGCFRNSNGSGGSGGQSGFAGGTGGDGGPAYYTGGGGGGGGAGLGGSVFVDSGAVTILDSSFLGSQTTGGIGGINPRSQSGGNGGDGQSGSGIVAGIFKRNGTVVLHDSLVNIVSTDTLMETWTNGALRYQAPIGTPQVSADGEFVLGNIFKRGVTKISLQTSFPAGTLVYSLDGSDPRISSTLYTSRFTVRAFATLRAVAYNSTFTASVEMEPVQITILPTLAATTLGGGSVATTPADGPYFSGSVAQLTAQPDSGFTFLQWLGDASGTNPTITVTMNRNKYVQAVFGTTVETTVVGGGAVLTDPSLPLYPFGTPVKLTAQPQAGNYFAQWGAGASGTNNPTTVVVSNVGENFAAVFSMMPVSKYSLTVIEDGRGHITRNPKGNIYSSGQSVTLTAVPDEGQSFIGWSGAASGPEDSLTTTMTSNKVITANFTKRPTLRVGTPLEGLVEEGFRMTLLGEFGQVCSILGSTNLLDWIDVGVVTNTYGTVQLTDPTATNSTQKFYRGVVQ